MSKRLRRGALGLPAAAAAALAVVLVLAARDDPPPADPAAMVQRAEASLDCDDQVTPALGRAVPARDVVAGRVVFVGLRETHREVARSLERARDGVGATKAPVAVSRPGGAVTVAIRRDARSTAAFAYGAELRRADTIAEGASSVTFEPCPGGPDNGAYTGWAGAVMTTKRQCLPVVVTELDTGRTVAAGLPLGVRSCPRSPRSPGRVPAA